MKLSEIKTHLRAVQELNFMLPNGNFVPAHFHITELGLVNKKFIDCGGTLRDEQYVTLQIWVAGDLNHRLTSGKLIGIIESSKDILGNADPEIEVEFQTETLGKYGVEFSDNNFLLLNKQAACLAEDQCGIPAGKKKISLIQLSPAAACCTPDSGCC